MRVYADLNPIVKVLQFYPDKAKPYLAFRVKLQQSRPIRAAARTRWRMANERRLGNDYRWWLHGAQCPCGQWLAPVAIAVGCGAGQGMGGGCRRSAGAGAHHPSHGYGPGPGIPAFYINAQIERHARSNTGLGLIATVLALQSDK